jgi:HD-GYP domain-containing protein (c-di-GMP phosphodiesterase class II)
MTSSQPKANPLEILDRLNRVGIALSSETDIDKLLEMILENTQDIINADGGTLYTLTENQTLKFLIIKNKSLNIKMGGASGVPIPFPEIPLYQDGSPNHSAIASHCAITKKSVNIEDAYLEKGFDFSGAKAFDEKTDYRTQSVLAVPLINHEGTVLGVLQLINCLDKTNTAIKFSDFSQKLAESLTSQAAISLQNRLLINQLQNLFEGLTNLINTAIDEKSPYTGGHCLRVPELTLMLAEATSEETDGPLADFKMNDKDRYELKVAGMLHDCGKITTPVHVVDKATKLETIFDRITLIETRAEALKNQLVAECMQCTLNKPASKTDFEAILTQQLSELDDDLSFLRKCNIGGERMRSEDVDRVKTIGERTWKNTKGDIQPFLSENEILNLTIIAGTLTQAERQIINDHISSTIKLLGQLEWPDHLKNVTEYAGGHHERMDGKGYPKGLTRDQMSIPARIMGIADIFEALTAADRPYKKGMPLSQSLSIMRRMKDEGHIDPDLFDIFIKHHIYLDYAKRYLKPEQIDIE